MRKNVRWGIAGLVAGLAAALAVPTFAQPTAPPGGGNSERTVTVTGSATIRSAPDEAVVTLGVRTQATTAEGAMQQNANRMAAIMRVLLDQGLRQGDIATAWINLYPNYDSSGLTIVGYTAENQVTATVRDMARIGRIIDGTVEAGANVLGGIAFQLSDENEGRDDALAEAVADARRKAEILAEASGASLGPVVTINEAGALTPPPIYYDRVAVAEAGATTPISPPTLESQVMVTVVWSLA